MTAIPSATEAKPTFHPASAPDFVPVALLRKLQLDRLQAIVGHAYERVAFSASACRVARSHPRTSSRRATWPSCRSPSKADLRDTYPFGLFASPLEEVVRLHASSGTTGKPIVVAYTKDDVEVWTQVMVRSFAACGLHDGDIVQNAYGYGLFTGGLGAHYGAEALGATVIPISGGNTDRQIMVMKDFGVTAICCTPSYFLHLIDRAGQLGVDFEIPAACVPACSAPSRGPQSMRRHIESVSQHRAPSTSTACRRLSARAWPSNARTTTACTSSRTTSTPRSSTPRPARCCPTAKKANWCSPP